MIAGFIATAQGLSFDLLNSGNFINSFKINLSEIDFIPIFALLSINYYNEVFKILLDVMGCIPLLLSRI